MNFKWNWSFLEFISSKFNMFLRNYDIFEFFYLFFQFNNSFFWIQLRFSTHDFQHRSRTLKVPLNESFLLNFHFISYIKDINKSTFDMYTHTYKLKAIEKITNFSVVSCTFLMPFFSNFLFATLLQHSLDWTSFNHKWNQFNHSSIFPHISIFSVNWKSLSYFSFHIHFFFQISSHYLNWYHLITSCQIHPPITFPHAYHNQIIVFEIFFELKIFIFNFIEIGLCKIFIKTDVIFSLPE